MSMQADSRNPFPGLRPFRQDEDYLFFGREDQTMELVQRLGSHRFVAVVGTSGSGKSSLVRCGLLSELLGGKMLRAGASWEIAITHPGGNPLALLVEALLEADLYDREEENARERLLATLSRSHFGLVEAVRQAGLGEGTNFLLVVDQFEEIFRFHEVGQMQQEVANEFVSILLQAVHQSELPIYVVLTMRSDFIGECGKFEGLAEIVNRGEFLIPALNREQYKRVIEGPIKVAGGKITPRLLQRLLNDLGEQADQLPCLQHALMRTWNIWAQNAASDALDLPDYQRVGKMTQALSQHADEIYESLSARRQELCKGVFQALTVQESDSRGVRRPQRLKGLCQILEVETNELLPIINAYRQHGVTFLMPPADVELTEQTIIDISHESLMRVWTRLRHWTEEEAQSAVIYRRLSESAAMHERGEAGLYRDPELGIALSWRQSRRPNSAWAARYQQDFAGAIRFLEKSQVAAESEIQEREAARQRELEQAKKLAETERLRAEEQHRAAIRLRWLVTAFAGVALIAIVAFAVAARARQAAVKNEGRALVAQAKAVKAAETAENALQDARSANELAEKASLEERRQRQVAEREKAAAVEAQKQLEIALAAAQTARTDAERAQTQAETAQSQAEDDRMRAVNAEQQAVADRKLAVQEKLLAEQNAELARRREKLFEELLPLLQEHAPEGVHLYAQKLESDGKSLEALNTFADFSDLVLGEQHAGFLAQQLLHLDAFDLQGLDASAIDVEISVPPEALFTHVLMPAIELGERQLTSAADDDLSHLVARIHTSRARLLQQYPNMTWPGDQSAANMMFQSYDRAASIEPDRYQHFLSRAGARFRLPDRDLSGVLDDLNKAVQLYPNPPRPVGENEAPTDSHRQLAQLYDAKGNVLEFLASSDGSEQQWQLLAEAESAHQQASALNPEYPLYRVGVARTLRKQTNANSSNNLERASEMLADILKVNAALPEAHNELGEVLMVQGQVVKSREAFENAVKHGKESKQKRVLYASYCNLANAYSRDPSDEAGYRKSLDAADQAIAIESGRAVEGQYYRGFALWKLGRIAEALEALSQANKLQPKHVDALLAQCQIIFEMKDPNPPTSVQLRQAYADAKNVLEFPRLTKDERAKAYYINSLGWLRHHVQEKSESSLVQCQDLALKAAQGSPDYMPFATQIFQYAAGVTWKNREQQQESQRLQRELKALAESSAEQ